MRREYTTTVGYYSADPVRFDDPVEPKGDDGWRWRMVGAAATDGLLFWFWEREVA